MHSSAEKKLINLKIDYFMFAVIVAPTCFEYTTPASYQLYKIDNFYLHYEQLIECIYMQHKFGCHGYTFESLNVLVVKSGRSDVPKHSTVIP